MTSTTFAIVFFTLCLAAGLEASTPYKSCSPAVDPIDFRMDGCTETPCVIYKGESATAEWDFEVTTNAKTLKPRVKAILFGSVGIAYDIGQENACQTLTNAECPLDKGEEITYALSMPVLASYPTVSITVEFALVDPDNNVQVCFQVPVSVKNRT